MLVDLTTYDTLIGRVAVDCDLDYLPEGSHVGSHIVNPAQIPSQFSRPAEVPSDILDIVDQIVTRYSPDKILLFGSHAYGQARTDSDVDILVIMDTPMKEVEQALHICRHIDYHLALDLLVRKPATVERRLALGDSFLREIIDRGKVLYARTDG